MRPSDGCQTGAIGESASSSTMGVGVAGTFPCVFPRHPGGGEMMEGR